MFEMQSPRGNRDDKVMATVCETVWKDAETGFMHIKGATQKELTLTKKKKEQKEQKTFFSKKIEYKWCTHT